MLGLRVELDLVDFSKMVENNHGPSVLGAMRLVARSPRDTLQ